MICNRSSPLDRKVAATLSRVKDRSRFHSFSRYKHNEIKIKKKKTNLIFITNTRPNTIYLVNDRAVLKVPKSFDFPRLEIEFTIQKPEPKQKSLKTQKDTFKSSLFQTFQVFENFFFVIFFQTIQKPVPQRNLIVEDKGEQVV